MPSRFHVMTSRAGAEPGGQPYHHEVFGGALTMQAVSSVRWPFQRHVTPREPVAPQFGIFIADLHRAFPDGQTPGTRLVLTQATYQLQRWLDWLADHPQVVVIADMTAATPSLAREAWSRRGPWSGVELQEAAPGGDHLDEVDPLLLAFLQPDPHQRLATCEIAAETEPTNPAIHLAVASTFMELQRLDDAHEAIHRALLLDADWEAVHFELGKLWLRREETGRAVTAFAEAGRLMPTFAAAFGNLGAALGELDRDEEALAALRHALQFDPNGHTILNNIGVVSRDRGDLDAAAAAFRQVTELAPEFVFGHYNLGHTLFLQGQFAAARDAYERGLERDQQKSPRQAARAAVVRAATGDADGAVARLDAAVERVPPDGREDLLLEADSTLEALSAIGGADTAVLRVRAFVRELLERTSGAP